MSFNLGNWADQLICELCSTDPPLNLGLPDDYLDGDLPDDFFDVPPESTDDGMDFDLPDYYPYMEFTDGGFIIGIHGSL